MTTQEKISISRKLNNKYNSPRRPYSLKELWTEIESECDKAGIHTDLIQMYPEAFELLATKPEVIEKYFYETK